MGVCATKTTLAAAGLLAASLAVPGRAAADGEWIAEGLLADVAAELGRIATESGHDLEEGSLSLSFAWDGLLLPGSAGGTIVLGQVATVVGLGLIMAVGAGASLWIPPLVAVAIGGGAAGSIAATIASKLPPASELGRARDQDYMFFRGHFRSELHYVLVFPDGAREEGSCLLFAAVDREVAWEVDRCSHDEVFPQEVPGRLRIGDGPDAFDRWMGQTDAVAAGSFGL